jgi:hypothetical protein
MYESFCQFSLNQLLALTDLTFNDSNFIIKEKENRSSDEK